MWTGRHELINFNITNPAEPRMLKPIINIKLPCLSIFLLAALAAGSIGKRKGYKGVHTIGVHTTVLSFGSCDTNDGEAHKIVEANLYK